MKSNVLFHQIHIDSGRKSIIEVTPNIGAGRSYLTINDGSLGWGALTDSEGRVEGSDLYLDGRWIGVGRAPLTKYKFDIKARSNVLDTVFHVGDGSYGFSMGNGTTQGFIPEIIGMGSDQNDAGLYFMGKSMSKEGSDIPLVIIGGTSPLKNRPILGVTSGPYDKYDMMVDAKGVLHVNDIHLNGSISFSEALTIIKNQQAVIEELVERVNEIQNNL